MAPIELTVRLVDAEHETVLAWAWASWACVIVNLCVRHDPVGIGSAQATLRCLFNLAREQKGSYDLTYLRWASREHVEACPPPLREFLVEKRQHDPTDVFQSDGYRHHCSLLDVLPTSGRAVG